MGKQPFLQNEKMEPQNLRTATKGALCVFGLVDLDSKMSWLAEFYHWLVVLLQFAPFP